MAAERAFAQGWSAQLVVAPLPSPYLSDWEIDPTIAQLIVTNPGAAATDVTFHYTVTRNGQMLLRGATDPLTIPGQQSVVFNGASTFGGRADWDRDVQQTIARTGKLPEGEYEGCVTLIGPGRIVLVERQCARFNTQSSDPPFLVSPANGDTLTSLDPIFEWQPVQVPPAAEARVGYVLQIAEVRTAAGQRPEVALESNILHYVEPNLVQTSHQYPVGALPLVSGRTYAWRVQALDGDGKPAATNQGRSEIWTFVYRETETEVTRTVARVELSPRRDTLRYAGDTARYEVTAYDADNVEILGKNVQWRSLDTTIVRVDSTGAVRGVALGETRIVASVDGIADSALSVMATRTLAVRFERYDAQTDKPDLLELIKSGSFDEIAAKLTELFESGELRLPIPRLPGVEGAQNSSGDEDGIDRGRSGPSAALHELAATRVADDCDGISGIAEVHLDRDRKVWALQLGVTTAVIKCLLQSKGTATDTTLHASALFAVSILNPGAPRVFLALKQIRNLPLPIPLPLSGMDAHTRFLVINPSPGLPSIEMKSDLLPADFAGFFGTDEFTAGPGLTIWSKHRCVASNNPAPACLALKAMAYDDPEIVVRIFAGVNASETSADWGSGSGLKPKRGHSLALGFSIQALLPVRRWRDAPTVAGLKLDSTQVGLLFSVQDSITPQNKESQQNWSIGLAPTATVWFTDANQRNWEFAGSIGVEADPTKPAGSPLKLVVTGSLGVILKVWYLRVGNPQLVVTRMLEQQGTVEVALSGTWGVGPWDSDKPDERFGLDTVTGGSTANDPGGSTFAGGSGIQQMGRGNVIVKWEKPQPKPAPPADNRTDYEKARDALREAKRNHAHYRDLALAQEKKCEGARAASNAELDDVDLRMKKELECEAYDASLKDQLKALAQEKEASDAFTNFRRAADPAAPPAGCTGTSRCFSWSANLAVNNGALVDVLAMLFRFIPGVP